MHVKSFIENLENLYGNDEFMDEELLEMIQENPLQEKEIQTNFYDIQENSQQLTISSFTQMDMSQNSDLTSYISFAEVNNNLQQSC